MPCHIQYRAPVVLVLKKDGKVRLVEDYRQLNQQTIKSCWPIPSIEETCDTLEGSAFFSTYDMSWGFYRLPMDERSHHFTAFRTLFGSYKRFRMPMCLTGSPNFFQSIMEHILVCLTWKTTVLYLDDGIIFDATPEEHLERLAAVLQRIRETNLKIYVLKCEFFKTKFHFLGHALSDNGLQVNPEKLAAIKFSPSPPVKQR